MGGAIGLDPRIKYDYREKTPGPGRYTPSMKSVKPKSAKYFIGEKTGYSALKLMTGTDQGVGLGNIDLKLLSIIPIIRNFLFIRLEKLRDNLCIINHGLKVNRIGFILLWVIKSKVKKRRKKWLRLEKVQGKEKRKEVLLNL